VPLEPPLTQTDARSISTIWTDATDARGHFRTLKCVAPFEMPLGTTSPGPRVRVPNGQVCPHRHGANTADCSFPGSIFPSVWSRRACRHVSFEIYRGSRPRKKSSNGQRQRRPSMDWLVQGFSTGNPCSAFSRGCWIRESGQEAAAILYC
jgi:hypothetical protein